jgi:hypothetical protein
MLDSIDVWILTQPTLINKRKRAILPVVIQRQGLADSYMKCLTTLGLERRHKVKTLQDILTQQADDTHDDGEPAANGNGTVHDEKAGGEG